MSLQVKNSNKLFKTSLLLFVAIGLLIPAVAMAVPGSGDFVSLYTESGRQITDLYNVIAKICLGVLIIVEAVLIAAILKFRRRNADERPVQNHGNLVLEGAWTLAALGLQVYIGVLTINTMFAVEVIPEDIDMTIIARAESWDWQFEYPEQGIISDDLIIPAHAKVKLEVTSRDVIHAIFIPELGVKIDAVPGRFNYWWFNADGPINQVRMNDAATIGINPTPYLSTRPDFYQIRPDATTRVVNGLEQTVSYLGASREVGEVSPYAKYKAIEYQGTCAELCGKGHWDMYFRAVVMTPSSFNQWVDDMKTTVTEVNGPDLYARQCATCHGDDGVSASAQFPSLAGSAIASQPENAETHIQMVLTGQGVMPPFGDRFDDAEVAAIVTHERTSWGNAGNGVTEEEVAAVRDALGLPPRPRGGIEPVPTQDLMAEGQRLYASCASCHGSDGTGLEFVPGLAGNAKVTGNPETLTKILLDGQDTPQWPGAKTALGKRMTDYQLSAILTYIRGSFGNEANPIQPHEVSELR